MTTEPDELNVTREELDAIGEALKCEQFRKLLCEYVDEINDPENRARYEAEVEQYERERGASVTFVRPRPGYVVKTSADGVRKVFVNICGSDAVQEPAARPGAAGGHHWSLPHCVSPARRDQDKSRRPCDVYDVVFHPRVLDMAAGGGRLRAMVEDTALSMVERGAGVRLDKANVKYPKMAFKGVARSLMIRKPIEGFRPSSAPDGGEGQPPPLPGCPAYRPPVDRPVQHHDLGALQQKSLFAVPKYVVKYRSGVDIQEHAYNMHCKMNAVIPHQLVVEIHLPLLDSSANVVLDVLPRSLNMVCHKPSRYKLEVSLPYSVLEEGGNATFDQSTKKLIVCLPVVRTEPPLEYVKDLVSEMEMVNKDELSESNVDNVVCDGEDNHQDSKIINDNAESIVMNGHHNGNTNEMMVTNGHHDENATDHMKSAECNNINNNNINDVHYILPEHELIFDSKYILTLNVQNVDPKSINVIVVNDKNLISGQFHSMGSGFFPIWFAFCLQIPSKSSLLMSDVKVLPSNKNIILEFALHFKPDCKQYWYGLDKDNLTIQSIRMEDKENSKDLANGVLLALNDSDDDDDIFADCKEKIKSNDPKQQSSQTSDDSCRYKDKNGKTTKEKGRKKKGKKIQKSNAIPITAAAYLPEPEKKIDITPSSLPTEFNTTSQTIRGILKKRSLSECSSNMDDVIFSPRLYSSSTDNQETESSDVIESSSNDSNNKKTVRFNDHVIEKKINFNISIAAQSKKHRQRQQRKRNIREYSTPSESEASEAEDRTYGPLNIVSESEETSVSESSAGEMSDDNSNGPTVSSKNTVVSDSKKDHKRRKSKSARKNASLAKQASSNSLIFPIEY